MIHNDPMDLYRALGLTSSATSEEIAAAFRKRAKETHPDSTGQASADAFREISDAYDILGDPVRRQEYDRAAQELYEQQATEEAVQRPERRAADPSPSRAVRSRLRRAIVIVWILVGCPFGVWIALEEKANMKAETALAQERDADISRRFPTCANQPVMGTFFGPEGQPVGIHSLRIENETLYNMLAKVRDVKSGRVVAAFFIPSGGSFKYGYIFDGLYKLQYAFGSKLDVSCRNLLEPVVISESRLREFTQDNYGGGEYYRFTSLPKDSPAEYGRSRHPAYYYVRVPLAEFLKP
ncbi:J domain-containing protein [Pleomorphomonas sp. PLEO]|uniref:J domain-containing protein n=1 Tax=Pleomorphomonas sp. PLEO TaxID=3239306 RepID=UPI00351F7B4D